MKRGMLAGLIAAAMLGLCVSETALAAGNHTQIALPEGVDAKENAVAVLSCIYNGNELSYTEEAKAGANVAYTGAVPQTVDGRLVIPEGNSGLLPFGVRLSLVDATGSASNLKAAVWSAENGQDDLVWVPMFGEGNTWKTAFNIADHRSVGLYYIHIYGVRYGRECLLGGLELDYRPVKAGAVSPVSPAKKYAAVFDPQVYYNNYEDLRNTIGMNADALYRHYENYGVKEGRVASQTFDVRQYKANYPDLQAAFGSDWKAYVDHYIDRGMAEQRSGAPKGQPVNPQPVNPQPAPSQPSNPQPANVHPTDDGKYLVIDLTPVFSGSYYLNRYADLKMAFGADEAKAFQHFLDFGMNEARQASENFDVKVYQARYPDLVRAFGNNLAQYYYHYAVYGMAEGRSAR